MADIEELTSTSDDQGSEESRKDVPEAGEASTEEDDVEGHVFPSIEGRLDAEPS